MDMDLSEREEIIYQIISGEFIIEYQNKFYIFKEPSPEIINRGMVRRNLNNKEYSKNKTFLTREEEKQMLESFRIWDTNQETRLNNLVKDLNTLRKEKRNYEFQSKKLKQIELLIEKTNEEITKLHRLKNTFFQETIKYQTDFEYYSWLLFNGLYSDTNERIWKNKEDFDNETNIGFITFFIVKIFYEGVFSEEQIRKIARSEPWRTKWKTSSKIKSTLFKDIGFQNKMQYLLCYWSLIYDSVFESYDCPAVDVIENDEALTEWLIKKQDETEEKSKEKNSLPITNKKIANSQEIFIAVDTPEDAQKVYNLNDAIGKNIFKSRQRTLMEKGKVREDQMPDTKMFLKTAATQAMTENIKKKVK